jgi:putative addiction module component (TIGR02574 family)
MLRDVCALLTDALQLSPEARVALAASLIESLEGDEEVDAGAEGAWRATIDRRLHELQSGAVQAIPWARVRERLQPHIRA